MIIIRINTIKGSVSEEPQKYFSCPVCKHIHVFYNYPDHTCIRCGHHVGNVMTLLRNARVREEYFRNGELSSAY